MTKEYLLWDDGRRNFYEGGQKVSHWPRQKYEYAGVMLSMKAVGSLIPIEADKALFNIYYEEGPLGSPIKCVRGNIDASAAMGFHAARAFSTSYFCTPTTKTLEAARELKKDLLNLKEDEEAAQNGVKKYDDGKAPMSQGVVHRFPLALQQIALVSQYGKDKYGTFDGWEKLPDALNRYTDAGARHDSLRASEGEYDVGDSGLPHRAQKAWNALAELELALREGVIEMTNGNEIENGKPVLNSNGRSND